MIIDGRNHIYDPRPFAHIPPDKENVEFFLHVNAWLERHKPQLVKPFEIKLLTRFLTNAQPWGGDDANFSEQAHRLWLVTHEYRGLPFWDTIIERHGEIKWHLAHLRDYAL